MRAGVAIVAAAVAAVAAPVAAQPRLVTVHGVAYDSLRGAPLEGAIVSLVGSGRTTVADRRGRFEIDSVAPGPHTFTMNHDAVDSLGLAGVSSRVEVTDGRAEVRLAIPAFAAFWARGCARAAPRDSILVYGAVRDPASLAPVAGAKVEIAWLDLSV
ncbi:MAG: carboxypeptidase regulatory-like domain-containing protein, partial [Gemmatimonadota bacterium]|nr:carboxypeptidase regulatory-like domain-containing protein [Gemmatimonadota bacterium]